MAARDYISAYCARCHEEFPIDEQAHAIQMGHLYPASCFRPSSTAHAAIEAGTSNFLCGNCYFDLTDEETG